uniref:SGNH hydrolase-type esterase domain-containing protein n=1 Tax=Myripristis murdjan TaxID=586833 RepID=A0A668A9T7_9TELE
GAPSPPSLSLSNKYAALSVSEKPAARDLHQETAPVSAAPDIMPPLTDTTAFPPLTASCPPASDGYRADAPTTIVIGDSIVRHVRMRGAFTLSFPGATVMDITGKIPDILSAHPHAKSIIIHAGANDIARQQSELLKRDFTHLFKTLSQSQVSVFISGPTPTCGRGMGSFSRLLSLNTWLSYACNTHHVGFIDNFDVFWERRHLFGPDGLHLNRSGARMLSANLTYGVQHANLPKPSTTDLSVTD